VGECIIDRPFVAIFRKPFVATDLEKFSSAVDLSPRWDPSFSSPEYVSESVNEEQDEIQRYRGSGGNL